MEIIISNSSSSPIYEQISSQIRDSILTGALMPGDPLPSIRALAASLRISAITTKRAYSDLEAQGYIETVPGKGCFVSAGNLELLREDRHARIAGLSAAELHEMLDLQLEEEK